MSIRPKPLIWLAIAAQLGAQTANWTQQNPPTSPSARGTALLAYDSKHSQVVLFGGLTMNGPIKMIPGPGTARTGRKAIPPNRRLLDPIAALFTILSTARR